MLLNHSLLFFCETDVFLPAAINGSDLELSGGAFSNDNDYDGIFFIFLPLLLLRANL